MSKKVRFSMGKASKLRNRRSQISSLILVMTAAAVLLASFVVSTMRKELIRTQLTIAVQSSALYLSSFVASYAWALACQNLGCTCHKEKKSWAFGLIILVGAVIAVITGHPELLANALTKAGMWSAMAWAGLGLGAVSDVVRWHKILKSIDKMLLKLAQHNPGAMFKWATIAYTASKVAEDSGLMERIANILKTLPPGAGGGIGATYRGGIDHVWIDKMHRKHKVSIKVKFTMPYIQTHTSGNSFRRKVTYDLVGCQGSVYVCVIKDGEKEGFEVWYDALHDPGAWTVRRSFVACNS